MSRRRSGHSVQELQLRRCLLSRGVARHQVSGLQRSTGRRPATLAIVRRLEEPQRAASFDAAKASSKLGEPDAGRGPDEVASALDAVTTCGQIGQSQRRRVVAAPGPGWMASPTRQSLSMFAHNLPTSVALSPSPSLPLSPPLALSLPLPHCLSPPLALSLPPKMYFILYMLMI